MTKRKEKYIAREKMWKKEAGDNTTQGIFKTILKISED